MIVLELKTPTSGANIEEACRLAAEELGYELMTKDNTHSHYYLGTGEQRKVYADTTIEVKREVLGVEVPLFHIAGIQTAAGRLNSIIYVQSGLPFGLARKSTIDTYLTKIGAALDNVVEGQQRPALEAV